MSLARRHVATKYHLAEIVSEIAEIELCCSNPDRVLIATESVQYSPPLCHGTRVGGCHLQGRLSGGMCLATLHMTNIRGPISAA